MGETRRRRRASTTAKRGRALGTQRERLHDACRLWRSLLRSLVRLVRPAASTFAATARSTARRRGGHPMTWRTRSRLKRRRRRRRTRRRWRPPAAPLSCSAQASSVAAMTWHRLACPAPRSSAPGGCSCRATSVPPPPPLSASCDQRARAIPRTRSSCCWTPEHAAAVGEEAQALSTARASSSSAGWYAALGRARTVAAASPCSCLLQPSSRCHTPASCRLTPSSRLSPPASHLPRAPGLRSGRRLVGARKGYPRPQPHRRLASKARGAAWWWNRRWHG